MIFRVIGGIVVYGFALYGVVGFLDRSKVKVVVKSDPGKKTPEVAGEQSESQVGGDHTESQVGA